MDAQLVKQLEQAMAVLKAYGASEVYLFGSATGDGATEGSDIDLAVTGVPRRLFFRAWADAARCFTRELDMMNLDDPSPFAAFIRDAGDLKRVG